MTTNGEPNPLLDRMIEAMKLIPAPKPEDPARIEAGVYALAVIRAAYRPPPEVFTPPPGPAQMLGLPIVLSRALDPAAVRVISYAGEVIREWTMLPPSMP